jgi:DNA replication and repair protein RecF
VAWSPEDVALVSGSPGERRRFLDIALALTSRPYLTALREYRAALERRNATLRDLRRAGGGEGTVAAWEPALARHGARLVTERRAWVVAHRDAFAELCTAIGERGVVDLAYESDVGPDDDPAAALAEQLNRERSRDLQRGLTGAGPHRDDLAIHIDGHDVRTFGSAGQQRTAAIVLRLLEARTLRDSGRGRPALLLDDPFAELDASRSARTLDLLSGDAMGQVILAVPREDDIPGRFARLARWRICAGVVTT